MLKLPFTHIHPDIDTSELVLVPGGAFMMGREKYDDEKPIHKVTVPTLAIGKFPVTQELWTAVMGNNPAYFIGPKRPVEQVSWKDTQLFLKKINLDSRLKPGQGFRLPTEAEWEYAARGGKDPDQRPAYTYAGGDKLDEVGWYIDNSHNETKPVGLKLPNELGICDLSGNVLEWCEDTWHGNYKGAPQDGSAWVDKKKGVSHVLRGGTWNNRPPRCRSSLRYSIAPADLNSDIGFRVVLFSASGS